MLESLSPSLFHLSSPPSLYSGMCVFVFFYFGLSFSSYANVQVVFVNSSKELLKNPSVMLKFAHNNSFVVHNPVFLVYGYQVTILHYLVFFQLMLKSSTIFWSICGVFLLFCLIKCGFIRAFKNFFWLYMYGLSEHICRMKPPNCAHGLGGNNLIQSLRARINFVSPVFSITLCQFIKFLRSTQCCSKLNGILSWTTVLSTMEGNIVLYLSCIVVVVIL